MTRPENDTPFGEVIEVISQNGLEGLAEAMSIVINQAMKVERSRVLHASPYERSTARIGYASGYKNNFLIATWFQKRSSRTPTTRPRQST